MGYQTVSGYLISDRTRVTDTAEELYENILILKDDGTVNKEDSSKLYKYSYNVDGIKIYIGDKTGNYANTTEWFLYKDNKKVGIGTASTSLINSAEKYNESYSSATPETTKFKKVVENIARSGAMPYDSEGNPISVNDVSFTGCDKIFNIDNKPEKLTSDFNEHKRAVIQRSIKSNLYTAMANFSRNSTSSYEFRMPEIDETEWDKVVSNVGLIAFMQGIPMGNKYYNDYCIVSNNNNKEFVNEDSIYIIGDDNNYHRVGCKCFQEGVTPKEAYLNIDFRRQTVKGKIDEDGDGNYEDKNYYYYPQEAQACYNCIVSQNELIDTETAVNSNEALKTIFYRAYAREKYNLYKVNGYLNDT